MRRLLRLFRTLVLPYKRILRASASLIDDYRARVFGYVARDEKREAKNADYDADYEVMNLDDTSLEIRVTLSLRLCVRRTIPSSRVQASRRDRFISSGLTNRAMMQPVHAENNNSALDMESLEEMLRKVTQSWISLITQRTRVLDDRPRWSSTSLVLVRIFFNLPCLVEWISIRIFSRNGRSFANYVTNVNYYSIDDDEWSARRNSKTRRTDPRDASPLCSFCPSAANFPSKGQELLQASRTKKPPARGRAGFQRAAISSNVFRRASLNGDHLASVHASNVRVYAPDEKRAFAACVNASKKARGINVKRSELFQHTSRVFLFARKNQSRSNQRWSSLSAQRTWFDIVALDAGNVLLRSQKSVLFSSQFSIRPVSIAKGGLLDRFQSRLVSKRETRSRWNLLHLMKTFALSLEWNLLDIDDISLNTLVNIFLWQCNVRTESSVAILPTAVGGTSVAKQMSDVKLGFIKLGLYHVHITAAKRECRE